MKTYHWIALMLVGVGACQQAKTVNLDEEREKILELHAQQRAHHFNKDSVAFASQLSENFISVNRGAITTPTYEETVTRYHNYFSAVEFLQWDDVTEPIIRFSEDGTLAYTLVDKMVSVTYDDSEGGTIQDETHYAWTTIYRKYGSEWKIDCVTSSNKPTRTVK